MTDADRPRFDAIVAQARRLLNSALVEVLVVVLAYLAALLFEIPLDEILSDLVKVML
jgi:hypothetical protein